MLTGSMLYNVLWTRWWIKMAEISVIVNGVSSMHKMMNIYVLYSCCTSLQHAEILVKLNLQIDKNMEIRRGLIH